MAVGLERSYRLAQSVVSAATNSKSASQSKTRSCGNILFHCVGIEQLRNMRSRIRFRDSAMVQPHTCLRQSATRGRPMPLSPVAGFQGVDKCDGGLVDCCTVDWSQRFNRGCPLANLCQTKSSDDIAMLAVDAVLLTIKHGVESRRGTARMRGMRRQYFESPFSRPRIRSALIPSLLYPFPPYSQPVVVCSCRWFYLAR